MLFDTGIYSSNMYPGCNLYTRYNTICYASNYFLHWSLGQEEKNWGGRGRRGDGQEAADKEPMAVAKRAFSSSPFAGFRESVCEGFERVVPSCAWAR